MKEYIEREAAYQAVAELSSVCGCSAVDRDDVENAINNVPAADVQEVRHGYWRDNGDRDSNGVPKPFAISCSVCGSCAGYVWMKYCPNCGAKMDGKGDAK